VLQPLIEAPKAGGATGGVAAVKRS
jgi:hypothetical protein